MGRRRGRPRLLRRKIPRIPLPVIFSIVVCLLLVVGAASLIKNIPSITLFKVKIVRVNASNDVREIQDMVARYVTGASLLSVDLDEIRDTVMEKYPQLKEVRILKQFPDTIIIHVLRSKALLQLKSDRYYTLNEELKVIKETRTPQDNLVVVEIDDFSGNIPMGTYIEDERIKEVVRLLSFLRRSKMFSPTTILAHRLDNLSFYTQGTKVILGDENFEKKLKILEALMRENYSNDFSTLRYIDLRYSKVYIGKR